MLIKIIKGTYGHQLPVVPGGKKTIVAKTSKDEPFEVSDAQAQRLIRLEVAVAYGEVQEEEGKETEAFVLPTAAELEKMTRKQLEQLALELELVVPDKANKETIKELIEEFLDLTGDSNGDDEDAENDEEEYSSGSEADEDVTDEKAQPPKFAPAEPVE
jgi:hypothetical protein